MAPRKDGKRVKSLSQQIRDVQRRLQRDIPDEVRAAFEEKLAALQSRVATHAATRPLTRDERRQLWLNGEKTVSPFM